MMEYMEDLHSKTETLIHALFGFSIGSRLWNTNVPMRIAIPAIATVIHNRCFELPLPSLAGGLFLILVENWNLLHNMA